MAKSEVITVNETTPTLLFHGVGTLLLLPTGGNLLIGGADLSQANGMRTPLAFPVIPLRVESDDKIYGLALAGSGTFDVNVFSCR